MEAYGGGTVGRGREGSVAKEIERKDRGRLGESGSEAKDGPAKRIKESLHV